MKYNKEEAFKRLKIPKELQRYVFVLNIPRFISWIAHKIGIREIDAGFHIGIFGKNFVIIFASDILEDNDYTLAHEVLGHCRQAERSEEVYEKRSRIEREAYAVTQSLLAIKRVHPRYYRERLNKIKQYKKGNVKFSLWGRLFGKIYYKNVNLKKLEEA